LKQLNIFNKRSNQLILSPFVMTTYIFNLYLMSQLTNPRRDLIKRWWK